VNGECKCQPCPDCGYKHYCNVLVDHTTEPRTGERCLGVDHFYEEIVPHANVCGAYVSGDRGLWASYCQRPRQLHPPAPEQSR
jgi:hypothetical protein